MEVDVSREKRIPTLHICYHQRRVCIVVDFSQVFLVAAQAVLKRLEIEMDAAEVNDGP